MLEIMITEATTNTVTRATQVMATIAPTPKTWKKILLSIHTSTCVYILVVYYNYNTTAFVGLPSLSLTVRSKIGND